VDKLNSDLLVVVLAILTDAVPRSAVATAMKSWTENSGQSLIEWFKRSAGLDDARIQALECLASAHLKAHQNDFRLSLDAWNAYDLTQDVLTEINDDALRTTLGASLGGDATIPRDEVTEAGPTGGFAKPHSPGVGGERFRLIRKHARGGIGQVWLARDGELQRDVAVKEIQPKFAGSANQQARFVLEAEITGSLEHPGIVPVYSLGRNADGQPYYAMRFIEGESFSVAIRRFHHIDGEQKVEPEARQRPSWGIEFRQFLRRFLDVCDAIDFAHSRNVLHRDLKPANIMLGRFGETLVVDWGLAKVLGKNDVIPPHVNGEFEPVSAGPSHTSSGDTAPGTTIGTPTYMSPEQARGAIDELGPASDVYSLGATLYELLVGQVPFPGKNLAEIVEKVVKGDFPRPRDVERTIPAPLEGVCIKAMSLQPSGRYQSVRAMAQDIEHWLADEPVAAYSERPLERFGRWLRQHRTLTYAAVAALVGVSLVATAAAVIIKGAWGRETAVRVQAETNFVMAQNAVEDYLTKVSENTLLKEQNSVDIRRLRQELLENALRYYKRFVTQRSDDPLLREQLANAYFRVGEITGEIGSAQDAIAAFRSAQNIWQVEEAANPDDDRLWVHLADCHLAIGIRQTVLGQLQEAMASLNQARALLEKVAGRRPQLASDQSRLANCYSEIGKLQGYLESEDHGLEMLQKAMAIQRQLISQQPGDSAKRKRLAEMINGLGHFYFKRTDFPAAIRCFQQVQEICVSLLDEITDGPKPVQLLDLLALSHYNIATMQLINKEKEKALESFEKSLEYRCVLVGSHPSVSSFREDLANSYREVAIQEQDAGDSKNALLTVHKAFDILDKLILSEPDQARNYAALGRTWNALGYIHDEMRDNQMAVLEFEKAVKEQRNAIARSPDNNEYKEFVCNHLENLGEQHLDLGSEPHARSFYKEALEIRQKLGTDHPENLAYATDLADALAHIGNIQRQAGDSESAIKSYADSRNVVERYLKIAPDEPAMRVRLAAAFTREAWEQADANQTNDALGTLQQAITVLEPLTKLPSELAGAREWLTEALQARARALRALKRNAEADKADADRAALWKGQPVQRLADLALSQTSRAALIGYGKTLVTGKAKSARDADLDVAADNLKLAIDLGYTDVARLQSKPDSAILIERADIKLLITALESRKQSSPAQPHK
jgi:eukaryotic-like serine/threonine-protein kinase